MCAKATVQIHGTRLAMLIMSNKKRGRIIHESIRQNIEEIIHCFIVACGFCIDVGDPAANG
jgi:hypothetical protein